jgi:hypothetical protein
VTVDLDRPFIECKAFVSDVREAYTKAELVLAPLTASAGTNSRRVLRLRRVPWPLSSDPARRRSIESFARGTALAQYDWNAIAARQQIFTTAWPELSSR